MNMNDLFNEKLKKVAFIIKVNKVDRVAVVKNANILASFVDGKNRWVHLSVWFRMTPTYSPPRSLLNILRKMLVRTNIQNVHGDGKTWDYVRVVYAGDMIISIDESIADGGDYENGTCSFFIKYKLGKE